MARTRISGMCALWHWPWRYDLGSRSWHTFGTWTIIVWNIIQRGQFVTELWSRTQSEQTDRWTDRQTDGRTDRVIPIHQTLFAGGGGVYNKYTCSSGGGGRFCKSKLDIIIEFWQVMKWYMWQSFRKIILYIYKSGMLIIFHFDKSPNSLLNNVIHITHASCIWETKNINTFSVPELNHRTKFHRQCFRDKVCDILNENCWGKQNERCSWNTNAPAATKKKLITFFRKKDKVNITKCYAICLYQYPKTISRV